jgi:ATP-dependent protease HslVU (ClpYQ) peptidase subunit
VINTAMDSSTQTTDGDIKLNSDLFDLAEKLQIQLQKKDQKLQEKEEELAKEKQKNQVCTFYSFQVCIHG